MKIQLKIFTSLIIITFIWLSISVNLFGQEVPNPQIVDTVKLLNTDSLSILEIDTSQISPSTPPLQLPDSSVSIIDSLSVSYFKGSIANLKLNNFLSIDTNTYNYQKFDPLYKNNGMYSTLSNIGQASTSLVYSPVLSTGYHLNTDAFKNYMYHNDSVKYYNLIVPYTQLNYVMASKREQNFNVIFTRNFFKGFNFGLDYALNFSPTANSPYLRSGVNEQRLFITSQYYTKNKRYGVIGNFLHNKLVVEENGGIKYDSVFEDNIESDRRIIPVNLQNAENYLKQSGFFIEQYFNILKPLSSKDSTHRRIDPGSITLSFKYRRNRSLYTDSNNESEFYFNHTTLIDTNSTFDSLTQIQYQSSIMWSNIGYHENPDDKIFYIYFGASNSIIEQIMPYDSVSSSLSQVTALGGIAFNFGKSFNLSGDVNYVFGNYNQDDYGVNAYLNQYLGTKYKNIGLLKFGLNFINRTPNWYFNNYKSNYYTWNKNLGKEKYLIISGSYNYNDLSFGAKFFTINNFTFINDSIRPQQLSKAESLMQLFAEGTIGFGKFGINSKLVYQTTSQPNIIKFPTFTGVMDIYFRSPIFKSAGILQTGFQVTYFTSYYADAYMPALRLFYNQNQKQIGNYPYLDVYVTLMVKRARLFVKWSHFNSYFGDYRYYLAPNYPARDARISFGASWRFHD